METQLTKEILQQFAQPFPLDAHKFKVQTTPKEGQDRALIVVYIDARDVMERLDKVVGGDWGDAYKPAAKRGVECALTVLGVTRCDVGDEDNQTEPQKSGYSDAFKRAAVKFGIGRYLYDLPRFWAGVKKVNDKIYVLEASEEERLRADLARALNGQPVRSQGNGASPAPSPVPATSSGRPRSTVSAVQRRKLTEIYRQLHGGTEAEAEAVKGLDKLFVEAFKHPLDAASYEEASRIMAQLLASQRGK